MKLSAAAFLAPVPESDQTLLVQPLSGQVALLDPDTRARLERLAQGGGTEGLEVETLRDAGFLVASPEEDRAALTEAYATYLEDLQATPTQLILVPSFNCNLKCTYCYQEVFDPEARALMSAEVLDGFFRYVDAFHAQEPVKPYITLFGGEPLMNTPKHRERVGQLLRGAQARGLGVAVVTNGYDLEDWAEELAAGPLKEVQVTLDGPPEVHDLRRPHRTGKGTYERIVRGVQRLVDLGVPVNLRVVADKDNLEALPALARDLDARGWLALPETRFKTQVGRNYELFGCAPRQQRERLMDRVGLWARFVEMAAEHPELKRFHQPRLHGMRHVAENGELPAPNFDACPAAKREWAFGPDGTLYGCTATVGNPDYKLGTFAPTVQRDEAAIAVWQKRNVFTIPKCTTCAVAPVCGGGCGAIAAAHGGEVLGPDCRPVQDIMGLGVKHYGLG